MSSCIQTITTDVHAIRATILGPLVPLIIAEGFTRETMRDACGAVDLARGFVPGAVDAMLGELAALFALLSFYSMPRAAGVALMITDEQIEALRAAAGQAGDYDQLAICDLALAGTIDCDDYTTLSPKWNRKLRMMSQADARAECEAVIADAAGRS